MTTQPAIASNPLDYYAARLTTAEEAVKAVKSGDRIWVPVGRED